MNSRRILAVVAFVMLSVLAWAAVAQAQGTGGAVPVSDIWPREFKLSNATLLVYQPQINTWEGNLVDIRAAVGVKPTGSDQETFGVIWGTTRTQVDRVARMVILEDLTLTKSNFPTLPDNGAAYMRALKRGTFLTTLIKFCK